MKLHEWKTRFAPRILRRGEEYYADGADACPESRNAAFLSVE